MKAVSFHLFTSSALVYLFNNSSVDRLLPLPNIALGFFTRGLEVLFNPCCRLESFSLLPSTAGSVFFKTGD